MLQLLVLLGLSAACLAQQYKECDAYFNSSTESVHSIDDNSMSKGAEDECDFGMGWPAKPGQFPFMVSLQWSSKEKLTHECSGALVTAQKILTAAQCYRLSLNDYYWAVAAEMDLYTREGNEQRRRVVAQYPHPLFRITNGIPRNDIAVFTVYSPFIVNSFVRPVSLPRTPDIPGFTSLKIPAWGTTKNRHSELSKEMLYAQRLVDSYEKCESRVPDIDENTICTYSSEPGPCLGDTGSPGVLEGVIYGVTSWVYCMCGPFKGYSMQIKVSNYMAFIKSHIGKVTGEVPEHDYAEDLKSIAASRF